MSRVTDFWKAHTDAQGRVVWPEEQRERDALARQLFGLCFVEALDHWLTRADDLIDSAAPPQESWRRASEDPDVRNTFAGMTEGQRATVRKIVRETALGMLFGSLVHIDQNPKERFDIRLVCNGREGVVHPLSGADLHDALYEWVWEFSDYCDLLMLKEEENGSVRWKSSGVRREGD